MNNYANMLNRKEDELKARFRQHPVLADLPKLADSRLEDVLLQRWALTMDGFERFYNTAIVSLQDVAARDLARSIIREEYPSKGANHREHAVQDLQAIGVDTGRILSVKPTRSTYRVGSMLRNLVVFDKADIGQRSNYDIRALTALRFAGEVLPGEEFDLFCHELERRYGLIAEKSVFYWPHLGHDKKEVLLGEPGSSHADRFGIALVKLVDKDKACSLAMCALEKSFKTRYAFYDQFKN